MCSHPVLHDRKPDFLMGRLELHITIYTSPSCHTRMNYLTSSRALNSPPDCCETNTGRGDFSVVNRSGCL